MLYKRQTGFTLIEILIALAILGIIVSIAVPSYGGYVKRAKVAEAIVISEEARTAIIAHHIKKRKFVENYGDWSKRNAEIGLREVDEYLSDTIVMMWVGSEGVVGSNSSAHVAILLDPDLGIFTNPSSRAMMLSTIEYKDGEYIYICGNTNALWPSNIKHEYLPASCRN